MIDCLVGLHWTLVRSEKGMGAAMTIKGGKSEGMIGNVVGMPLKKLAAYVKSWDLVQASLGQAAINAMFNTPDNYQSITGVLLKKDESQEANGFKQFMPEITGKKVAVIGHFPNIESLASSCQLSIIERDPQEGDYPDPASEYLLPNQDYVFITGTAFINKTMPRLLQLAQNARIILVGPSVPLSPLLFEYGVSAIAGMVILDEQQCWKVVQRGGKMKAFKQGGQMVCIRS